MLILRIETFTYRLVAENRFATFPQRRKAVYTEVFLNSVPTDISKPSKDMKPPKDISKPSKDMKPPKDISEPSKDMKHPKDISNLQRI